MADGPLSQSPRQRDAQHGPSRPFGDTPFTSKLRTCLETQAGKSLNFEELAPRAGRDKHLRAELSNLAEDGLAVREHPLEHTRTLWPTGCRFASTARLATRENFLPRKAVYGPQEPVTVKRTGMCSRLLPF